MGTKVTTIRAMADVDVPVVAALEAAHQSRPWSEQVFSEELATENRIYLVAEGPDVVGFGGVMVTGEEAHVTNLLVAPEHRGRGVGRLLMVELIEGAVADGARHLTLEVRRKNHAARALYSRMGLAPVGMRPRYYGDDDAVILWAHDIDGPDYRESLK